MSLAAIVQPVFAALATTIGTSLTYRTLTSGTWSAASTVYGEIKATTIGYEQDEHAGGQVKRQRATAKIYDRTATPAPTLKLGDEIIDASSVYWKIHTIDRAEIGNGIYRYGLVRDVPLRGETDRGGHQPEGGSTAVTGHIMASFTATNVEASATIFYGALVQRTTTGVVLAVNNVAGKDAIGICTTLGGVAVSGTATVATEGAFTTTDWTAIAGVTSLTVGTVYYLAAVAGQITATIPVAGWRQPIGTATSATTLDLEIVEPIQI